jgi:hypothetical protein
MSWRFVLLWVFVMGCAGLVVAGQVLPWRGSGTDQDADSPQVAEGGSVNQNAAVAGAAKKNLKIRKGLNSYHANAVQIFSQAPGFGLTRMPILMKKVEEEVVILSPGELDVDSPLVNQPQLIEANKKFAEFFADKETRLFDARLRGNFYLPANIGETAKPVAEGTTKSDPAATKLWRIETLNLVGLLEPKKPVVYVSHKVREEWIKNHFKVVDKDGLPVNPDNPPAVAEIKDNLPAGARLPNMFEEAAIQKLLQGQSLFVYGQEDTIRMMGALHATRQCLQCHDVLEGEVLGALSYTLRKWKR